MELFVKRLLFCIQPLTNSGKTSILDVLMGFEYATKAGFLINEVSEIHSESYFRVRTPNSLFQIS